ncbi:MAG: NRDE family protein [Bernardetiaceae bacterium]|jgi:uncharacterized protein with NRDE domain|nr:NRDE family protein [Bernardetiaceae bacterium]
MCLIVFAWNLHPRYRLVLVANRDEFYARPTQAAHWWAEPPGLLAGQDLTAGGTWLGLTRTGRWAALTNYRDPAQFGRAARSRGELPTGYLAGSQPPAYYLAQLHPQAATYNGFNLLVGDQDQLYYYGNYQGQVRPLAPGLYGLSNHLLDTPWYKVETAKARLHQQLAAPELTAETLLDLLHLPQPPPDEQVQRTGLPLAKERMLAPLFIASPDYGTCSTTSLLIDHQGRVCLAERNHNPLRPAATQQFKFNLEPGP